jgi:hypothetical protein
VHLFISLHKKLKSAYKEKIVEYDDSNICKDLGLSRVYAGVHYLTDVIAGFAADWCWLHIFIILSKLCFIRQK